MKVANVMTREVAAVSPETPLKEAARLFVTRGISGAPVVDADGRVVGVLAESDIVRKEQGAERGARSVLARLIAGPPVALDARTAGEAMSAPAVTAAPEDEVAEAARAMTEQGVNRLPVVAEDGSLAGIVTRADLVRAFVRSDAEIERELREEVILRTLWIDPARLEVDVRDGEVLLAGEVEQKADAELIAHFASRVPGVVSVRTDLRWLLPDGRRLRS